MDDFRAASRQSWATVAPDWGELTAVVDRQLKAAAEWMIQAVQLTSGQRVLELAGGPGTLSLMAAARVGPQGHVTCTDFAEPMVEVARRRIAGERVSNVECRPMDAEAIDLADASVDAILCRMGYMLMADPRAALQESARVLAPGGRLTLAVWSKASENPWAAIPMQALMSHLGAPPPPSGSPGLWALADEEQLRAMLQDAGLEVVSLERLDDEVNYESVDQWFEVTSRLAGPIRALMASLDEHAIAEVKQRMSEGAAPFLQADGTFAIPERMLAASAQRR